MTGTQVWNRLWRQITNLVRAWLNLPYDAQVRFVAYVKLKNGTESTYEIKPRL
jgi:hypothetical protein